MPERLIPSTAGATAAGGLDRSVRVVDNDPAIRVSNTQALGPDARAIPGMAGLPAELPGDRLSQAVTHPRRPGIRFPHFPVRKPQDITPPPQVLREPKAKRGKSHRVRDAVIALGTGTVLATGGILASGAIQTGNQGGEGSATLPPATQPVGGEGSPAPTGTEIPTSKPTATSKPDRTPAPSVTLPAETAPSSPVVPGTPGPATPRPTTETPSPVVTASQSPDLEGTVLDDWNEGRILVDRSGLFIRAIGQPPENINITENAQWSNPEWSPRFQIIMLASQRINGISATSSEDSSQLIAFVGIEGGVKADGKRVRHWFPVNFGDFQTDKQRLAVRGGTNEEHPTGVVNYDLINSGEMETLLGKLFQDPALIQVFTNNLKISSGDSPELVTRKQAYNKQSEVTRALIKWAYEIKTNPNTPIPEELKFLIDKIPTPDQIEGVPFVIQLDYIESDLNEKK